MPSRAFVPAPLIDVQPRVFKSFRGRQLKGLLLAVASAGLVLWVVGVGSPLGYTFTFLAALPGFAYGYYQPHGKPVEYWIAVLVRYHLHSQRLIAYRPLRPGQALRRTLRQTWAVTTYLARQGLAQRRERLMDGR